MLGMVFSSCFGLLTLGLFPAGAVESVVVGAEEFAVKYPASGGLPATRCVFPQRCPDFLFASINHVVKPPCHGISSRTRLAGRQYVRIPASAPDLAEIHPLCPYRTL